MGELKVRFSKPIVIVILQILSISIIKVNIKAKLLQATLSPNSTGIFTYRKLRFKLYSNKITTTGLLSSFLTDCVENVVLSSR